MESYITKTAFVAKAGHWTIREMLQFLINNPLLIPFVLLFVAGGMLFFAASIHQRKRTKTLVISPMDIFKWDKAETYMRIVALGLAAIGIIGVAITIEKYGYYDTATDNDGNKSKVWVEPPGKNSNALYSERAD